MKKCSKCKVDKVLEDFSKISSGKKDGVSSWCKCCHKEYCKNWHNKNKTKVLLKQAIYRSNHKEEMKESNKNYYYNNKKRLNKARTVYFNERRKKDVQFKLKTNLRTRIATILKDKAKTGSAIKDLGCSGDQLIDWLERQFEDGMSWENYGNGKGHWNIDHEYPLSLVDLTNRKYFLPLVHYTNLQPMWCQENNIKNNKL